MSAESAIRSYPSIYAVGHKAIEGLFDAPVTVEEKVDGSQFSFALIDGAVSMRSKGATVYADDTKGMFATAVAEVLQRAGSLVPGWVYRGEYLSKPKHNTLSYDRVPAGHIALFDINTGHEEYLGWEAKAQEAARLGFECVPLLHVGPVDDFQHLIDFLNRESFLGGPQIEGFVVKRYDLFTAEKKAAMGKYVSEAFKESHASDWKRRNPTRGDFIEAMTGDLRTEARWRKAVQHLAERGDLDGSPRDIGALIKEAQADIEKEEAEAIAAALFAHFWPQIKRGVTRGLPEWYKQELAQGAFQ